MKKKSILNNMWALLPPIVIFVACHAGSKTVHQSELSSQKTWIPLLKQNSLKGWTSSGVANWKIHDGVLSGDGGRGHIYAAPVTTDFEIKGEFRITDKGQGANSGLYFRATAPVDDPNGFPRGYEAQICNNQEAFTGWLWKPGTPTGKDSALLTKDGEWFSMRVLAVGSDIKIFINDSLVTSHSDSEYHSGKFVIQCHNDGMLAEARALYYRPLN